MPREGTLAESYLIILLQASAVHMLMKHLFKGIYDFRMHAAHFWNASSSRYALD